MKDNDHANELREQFISIILAGEAGINAVDRNNDYLLLYNADELLLVARRIHVIASAYKKMFDKATLGDGRHG